MVFETLQILKEELDTYFSENDVASTVTLGNMAVIDEEGEDSGNVILTLINMQEEFTLKNNTNHYTNGTEVSYKNPRINLNLYVLFGLTDSSYKEALKHLTKIVEFFQGKKVFTQDNVNFKREGDMMKVGDFTFILDLHTPSFEELNFIWGTLGGKQYPSVIYKVTLLEIEREHTLSKRKIITGLNNGLSNK